MYNLRLIILCVSLLTVKNTCKAQDTLAAYQYWQEARTMANQKKREKAIKTLEKALALYKSSAVTSRDTLIWNRYFDLHIMLYRMYYRWHRNPKYPQEILEQAIEESRQVFGKDNLQEANLYNHLGYLGGYEYDFDKAMTAYKQSLAIKQKMYGDEYPDIMKLHNDIGMMYKEKGDFEQAEAYYRKVIAHKENHLFHNARILLYNISHPPRL